MATNVLLESYLEILNEIDERTRAEKLANIRRMLGVLAQGYKKDAVAAAKDNWNTIKTNREVQKNLAFLVIVGLASFYAYYRKLGIYCSWKCYKYDKLYSERHQMLICKYECMKEGHQKRINSLRTKMVKCDKSKDKDRCIEKYRNEINKLETKIKELDEKIKRQKELIVQQNK